ncbi:MAG: ZIP family metal transporter [Rubrobacteraceae bacterium]
MTESPFVGALLFGLAASSALVIGGVAGAFWDPPRRLVAVALAFASGALITALSFDLFEESFRRGGVALSGIGLLAGAGVFVAVDEILDRYVEGAGGGVSGFAILAAVTLDGIPENMALGVTILQGAGTTLLVAVFASNLPEALSGAVGMRAQEWSRRFVVVVWSATALLLAASVVVGSAALSGVGDRPLSVLLAFAGGAVLASLADTLMPEAYREGGGLVAFATVAGFFLSFMVENL